MEEKQQLFNDILELKTWIREVGQIAKGKSLFKDKKIHSEQQLNDLIYKFNEAKEKHINIIWFNEQAQIIANNQVLASAEVIISNGKTYIERKVSGVGEEKRSDISFGLGKALTYTKRFWLQKFLDLSSENLDPEHISNKITTKTTPKTPKTTNKVVNVEDPNSPFITSNGMPAKNKDKTPLTKQQVALLQANGIKQFWNSTDADLARVMGTTNTQPKKDDIDLGLDDLDL